MAHHHHPHDEDAPDWDAMGADLILEAEVTVPVVEGTTRWLTELVPQIEMIIDVGSGPGVAACSMAQAFPAARVLAVDGAPSLLDLAKQRAARLGLSDRVTTREAKLPDDLAGLPLADVIWASGVVHHLPDPLEGLKQFARLLRPGGVVAIREGGLPMRFLPDGTVPGLLARVEVACDELLAEGHHPGGIVSPGTSWPDVLRAAGLSYRGSRSFLFDRPAPLSVAERNWVSKRLDRMRDAAGDRLRPDDQAMIDRLVDPDAPDGIAQRDDVFVLGAATIHVAGAA
jgi:SAM-dependent methyltransferase